MFVLAIYGRHNGVDERLYYQDSSDVVTQELEVAQMVHVPTTLDPPIYLSFPLVAMGKLPQATNATALNCFPKDCVFCSLEGDSYTQANSHCRICPDPEEFPLAVCAASLDCPSGYYPKDGYCFKCPLGCSECSSATVCTKCTAGLIVRLKAKALPADPDEYECECPDGQFSIVLQIGSQTQVACSQCDEECHTCDDSSNKCTSCDGLRYLTGNLCVTDCDAVVPKTYEDAEDHTCQPCDSHCNVCTGPGKCTQCEAGANKYNSNGVCGPTCLAGTVHDLVADECVTCNTGCSQCSVTYDFCTECDQYLGYKLDTVANVCLLNCATNQFH